MEVIGWEIEYIIRCLATHFLFSAYLGYSVYWLTQTILSKDGDAKQWFPFSFSVGCFVSVLVHILLDWFTKIA